MLGILLALNLLATAPDPTCQDNKIDKIEEMGKIVSMADGATYRIKNGQSNVVYSGWIKGDPVSICGKFNDAKIINFGAGETILHSLRLK